MRADDAPDTPVPVADTPVPVADAPVPVAVAPVPVAVAPLADDRGAGTTSPARPDPAPAAALEELETSYHLRVDLRYRPPRLAVRQRIDLCNRSARTVPSVHLSVLARAFRELRVHDVRVDGEGVVVTYPNAADMLVPMGSGLEPGATARIDIRFVVRPTRALRTSLEEALAQANGMLRVSDWFPIVSDGHGLVAPGDSQVTAAARRITLDLRLDRRLDVAVPGRRVGGSGRRHVYTIRNARDLAFVVAPRMARLSTRTDRGVRIDLYATADGQARQALRAARRAMERFEDAFGPYPWRRLVIAPTPSLLGGDEYPGIAFVGWAWLRGPDPWEWRALKKGRPGRWFGLRYVVSHEVAHQWFYAMVGSDQLHEPWLDEGMAEFAAHHFFRPELLGTCATQSVASTVRDFDPGRPGRGCRSYTEVVYRRAAVMIDGVRELLGDEAFFAAMRAYVGEHRFGIAGADDLIAAWRRHAPSSALLDAHLAPYLPAGPATIASAQEQEPVDLDPLAGVEGPDDDGP